MKIDAPSRQTRTRGPFSSRTMQVPIVPGKTTPFLLLGIHLPPYKRRPAVCLHPQTCRSTHSLSRTFRLTLTITAHLASDGVSLNKSKDRNTSCFLASLITSCPFSGLSLQRCSATGSSIMAVTFAGYPMLLTGVWDGTRFCVDPCAGFMVISTSPRICSGDPGDFSLHAGVPASENPAGAGERPGLIGMGFQATMSARQRCRLVVLDQRV
jgi:hypothetical protein